MIIKAEKKALFIILLVLTIILMLCIEIFSWSFSTIFIILIGGIIGIVCGSIKKAGKQE